jgi:hypothetical protein
MIRRVKAETGAAIEFFHYQTEQVSAVFPMSAEGNRENVSYISLPFGVDGLPFISEAQ